MYSLLPKFIQNVKQLQPGNYVGPNIIFLMTNQLPMTELSSKMTSRVALITAKPTQRGYDLEQEPEVEKQAIACKCIASIQNTMI